MAEKEYIEREALKNQIAANKLMAREPATKRILSMIDDIPAADVVPVVRCKDCVHYSNNNLKSQLDRLGYCLLNEEITDDKREPSDFCSYGERKGNENG